MNQGEHSSVLLTIKPSSAGNSTSQEGHYAPSINSSRMTDIASEDGNEYHSEGVLAATVHSQERTSFGNLTRPASSQRETRNRSTRSRRGVMTPTGSGSWRSLNAFGGPGVSVSNSSRPQSAASRLSRSSRTHAPSIASHAFFRPMSSQILQAQRSGLLTGSVKDSEKWETAGSFTGAARRQSPRSATTSISEKVDNEHSPPSMGTDLTENDPRDRASANASPNGNATNRSAGESTRPLHDPLFYNRQPFSGFGASYRRDGNSSSTGLKPATSLRSSFLLPSRNTLQTAIKAYRDVPPSSDLKMLREVHRRQSTGTGGTAGRNHEHFSGNTVFFWGGRLQNTKDRPINIATGTIVVLPSILFFIFSYVVGPLFYH